MSKDEFILNGLKENEPKDSREASIKFWDNQYDLFMEGERGECLHDFTLLQLM